MPHDHIKMIDSAIFENHTSPYDGDPKQTAAEFQKRIRQTIIKEIISEHEGEGIIHSHDWMAGGIITAYCKMRKVPVLHTVHNTHTGHIPLEMFYGVNVEELWNWLYFSNDGGRMCVDCQATAIKNATLVNYVGRRFLEETVNDYFLDRPVIPWSVRQETKMKFRYGSVFAIPNGISPTMYPEEQIENPQVDKPGLAKKYGVKRQRYKGEEAQPGKISEENGSAG